MKAPILMLIIMCFLCAGVWATRDPKCMANESLAETNGAINFTEILKVPFQKDDNGLYVLMSPSVTWALKYVTAKVKRAMERFERNMKILIELHRRRKERMDVAMRARQRRFRKVRVMPPLKLAHHIGTHSMIKDINLYNLAVSINDSTKQRYMLTTSTIAAIL
ncbi:uncharacterized protein [Drosophila kikkawai]|uniref:Uncharacterized protein n=1 Tax=Drosophila kikkawai TaxID=30033 RepID=A0A6P4J618_DROKI|nr:uncharacterized protein LOC108079934 [Drosophila kikkawai]